MTRWRVGLALALAVGLAVPLLWAVAGAADPAAWPDADALARLLLLWRTTLVLVAATLALSLPAGVALAVLLERTDLPGRGLFAAALTATLFVPLPLFTSAWQVVLAWVRDGVGGVWSPWSVGMGSAAWIHAAAGLPWVVLLVGWGLRGVERDLEEDASLVVGPAGVLWRVSLPRCAASVAAAALWVALQTATEITVTDVMQVSTAAEEVYTQFVTTGGGDPLARAVAASLAQVLAFVALVAVLARQADRLIPAAGAQARAAVVVGLGPARWPAACLVGLLVLGLTAVPVGGLLWRAGLSGRPAAWSAPALGKQLAQAAAADAWVVLESLATAGAAGALCGVLALLACWLARESAWLRAGLLVLLAVAWAMPGPVVGLGLKGTIEALLRVAPWPVGPVLDRLLWQGPSYAPVVWVHVIRLLPFAVAFLWPVVRLLPRELFEGARLDGASPAQEFRHLVVSLRWPAALRAALAVAALSLGELSGGKMVSTPGAQSYAELVFAQMHYGVTADLAAQCLLLLAVVLAAGAAVVGAGRSRVLPLTGPTRPARGPER
jgi:iron(III) transport system permease protein